MNIISRVQKKIYRTLKEKKEGRQFSKNVELVKKLSDKSDISRKYIIDCGFNEGVVAEKLLCELNGFSLRGFEVQQDLFEFAERLKKKYIDRDIDVIFSAVSNATGTIKYFEPESWGKNYKGSTTVVENKRAMGRGYLNPKFTPAINFGEWISENFRMNDFLFVKMDIEGAEYDVLNSIMNDGSIDLIDVLAVEWHADKFEEPQSTKYREIEKRIKAYSENHEITVLDWY